MKYNFITCHQRKYFLVSTIFCSRVFATRAKPSGAVHLDKLLGIAGAFTKIKKGEINPAVKDWAEIIKPYLL